MFVYELAAHRLPGEDLVGGEKPLKGALKLFLAGVGLEIRQIRIGAVSPAGCT